MTQLTKRQFVGLVATGALGGIAGCGNTEDSSAAADTESSPTQPEPTDTEAVETPTDAIEVLMVTDNRGSYFDPKGLLVEPGTTIRFVNESGVHASAAYHPDNNDKPLRIPSDAESWETELFDESGVAADVTLNTKGVYDFYCPPHESLGMVGRIIVDEPNDGPGTTPPTKLPPAARERLPAIETILDAGSVAGP